MIQAEFVWTVSDAIGIVMLGILVIAVIGFSVYSYIRRLIDWLKGKR